MNRKTQTIVKIIGFSKAAVQVTIPKPTLATDELFLLSIAMFEVNLRYKKMQTPLQLLRKDVCGIVGTDYG